jgi:hypothetical protein
VASRGEASPLTRRGLDALLAERRRSLSSTMNSTSVGPPASSCGAFPETRAASCYKRYMSAPAVTTLVREHLSEWLAGKVSAGPQQSRTPRTSHDSVKGASSMLDKLTFRRRRFRPSPSRGLLPSGTSTWWDHSDEHPGLHSPSRGGQQVLQVDRGSTHRQRPLRRGGIFLHRHHLPLRHTQHDHHRQRHSVHREDNPQLLRQQQHPCGRSAVAHPKTNRQVERANGMILQGPKPRIFKRLEKF